MVGADATAECLEAAARAGRLDHRGRLARLVGELFGSRLAVGEHGRRTDDLYLVAGSGVAGRGDERHCGDGRRKD